MVTINESELTRRVQSIYRNAGFNETQAVGISRPIVAGERDACKSHGIYRIDGNLRTVKAGKANPLAVPTVVSSSVPSVVRVDADGGFANPAVDVGLPLLIERTRSHGIAALVINNAAHFSALWLEIEGLAAAGLASLAMCPSYATVAPAGGSGPLLGTNPFAFGWPRSAGDPFVFDIATSVAARGEIELHRRSGTPLPDGWALDAEGKPTNDPTAALAGAMLTFGGYKGSAISIMIELLAGVMIGDATSKEALATLGTTTLIPTHGELVLAFSPEAFSGGATDTLQRAEMLFDAIVGQGARLPSQRRFAARAHASTNGIELTDAEVAHLDDLEHRGMDAV
jgi:delta1-piperideine-2-carboxylate reductase